MAFSVGTPVVTWDGDKMCGRMTSGLYSQMGMKGPVARTVKEFSDLAVEIATNTDYRFQLKQEILEKSVRLFDDLQAVRDFEDVLEGKDW